MSGPIDPPHYRATRIQPIHVVETWGLGFCLANVVKYVARAQLKGTRDEDLEKALNYLHRELTGRWLPRNWRELTAGEVLATTEDRDAGREARDDGAGDGATCEGGGRLGRAATYGAAGEAGAVSTISHERSEQ